MIAICIFSVKLTWENYKIAILFLVKYLGMSSRRMCPNKGFHLMEKTGYRSEPVFIARGRLVAGRRRFTAASIMGPGRLNDGQSLKQSHLQHCCTLFMGTLIGRLLRSGFQVFFHVNDP